MNSTVFNSIDPEARFNELMEWGFALNRFRIQNEVYVRYALHNFFAVLILRVSDNTLLDLRAYPGDENPAKAEKAPGGGCGSLFQECLYPAVG